MEVPLKFATKLVEAQTQTDTLEHQSCSSCEADFFCPICQETEKCILVLPTCHHRLHTHCAPPWFGDQKKDTCPICRETQPPSFLHSFQQPAAISAKQRSSEIFNQRLHSILDNFSANIGDTPIELARNMQSALRHLDGLSRWISSEEERAVIQHFQDNLRNMLHSNRELFTEDVMSQALHSNRDTEDVMSQADASSSEDSDEEWLPVRLFPVNEDRTVRTQSVIDQRTRHVIENLNTALSCDRNGIEQAITHSLRQLSSIERMEMDQRNRAELRELRRNLIDRLPSSRHNELVYFEDPPQHVVRSRTEGRTLRQMARNPFTQRETPVGAGHSRDPRRRLFHNESDTIQIVDVRSVRN